MIFWPFKKIPQDKVQNVLDYLYRQDKQKERQYFFGIARLHSVDKINDVPKHHLGKDICHFTWRMGKPDKITIYSADESRHNGSPYGELTEEVDVSEEFFDGIFRLMIAEAEEAIIDEIKKEEAALFRQKVACRLANTINCRIISQ